MTDRLPASGRCAHCGAEISPAATVCGFCQKPVGHTWVLRPVLTGLIVGLVLGLLAAGAIWMRAAMRRAAAQEQAAAADAAPPAAPADQDPTYTSLLTQAEGEAARGDYRQAVAVLMQALSRRPDRPEARARLEALRAQLMREQPTLAAPQAPRAPPQAPPEPADMVFMPAGHFTMGADQPGGSEDEYPAHEVFLSSYSIEAREVTVEQYRDFCAQTKRGFPRQPSWSTPQHPVVSVTWHDARAYCRHLGRRLPTEAEWERAARCDARGRWPAGSMPEFAEAFAWFALDSEDHAHPVGLKAPGGCRLYDAYGNVWEWVSDWYFERYYDSSPKQDPRGPRSGDERVLRGGAFDSPFEFLSATYREKFDPKYGAENRGFRCAASPAP
ncbi:MAG: SUMF1/EgtB/PvdO family nonheme iron enzyme [Elusimicrobia bacterium]|nr:SUMF1/EgtB/PvdO family nonheme iron enzyme [Elusimicrobiota bacterium]